MTDAMLTIQVQGCLRKISLNNGREEFFTLSTKLNIPHITYPLDPRIERGARDVYPFECSVPAIVRRACPVGHINVPGNIYLRIDVKRSTHDCIIAEEFWDIGVQFPPLEWFPDIDHAVNARRVSQYLVQHGWRCTSALLQKYC